MSDEINGKLVPSDESDLAAAIRRAVGAGPYEDVTVYAPPHRSRGDGKVVTYRPTRAEFDLLRTLPREKLVALGLRSWDEVSGLLLFPVEWYDLIPDGFELVCIDGEREVFESGKTDNDCRFGVLAYGIVPQQASHD